MNPLEPQQIITVRPSPKRDGLRWSLGLLLLIGIAWYIHLTFGQVLAWWLLIFLIVLLTFVILGLGLWLARAHNQSRAKTKIEQEYLRQEQERTVESQLQRQKVEAELQEAQAKARKAEQEAEFFYVKARWDEGLFVRDMNPHAVWRPIHRDPRHRINGVDRPPSNLEILTWQQWYETHRAPLTTTSTPAVLTAGSTHLPERIDLLDWLPAGRGNLRSIFLGVRVDETSGQLREVTVPIGQLVHIANGGATDSGKSNMIRAIAFQVITADRVQVIMVDLKRQTFKVFRDCDRLMHPVVTDTREFVEVLAALSAETERRLALFEPYLTVETIHDYNRLADTPLPYIVTFIDEISNIFQETRIQAAFLSLIRISRAAGIYFVCAGQTWSYRTLTTEIRDQFRTRVHFGTNDSRSSQMLLNDSRATRLAQQGRAYIYLPFGLASNVFEIQTPYLSLEGALEILPPGAGPLNPVPLIHPHEPELSEAEKDERFKQLVEGGMSRNMACQQSYGRGYAGDLVTRGKRVLGEL